MSNVHSAYPNPTITEAVCDIHFRFSETREWKPSLPGELFKYIQDDYPEMEPVLEMGLQFEFGPSGAGTKFLPQSQKVRFKHKNRHLILQLAENSFSVSTLTPYQGWEIMRHDILSTWRKVVDILQPTLISRVGLRYINTFEKETLTDSVSNWLVETDYIPDGILRSEPGFFLRVQSRLDVENVLMITLGDVKSEASNGLYEAIVFDIDRVIEKEIVVEQEELERELEQLHVDVWNVFSSAKGKKLDNLLNRRS